LVIKNDGVEERLGAGPLQAALSGSVQPRGNKKATKRKNDEGGGGKSRRIDLIPP